MKWLRRTQMAILWTVLRVWLGIQWLKAGIPKIGSFDAEGFFTNSEEKIKILTLPTNMRPIIH